MIRPFTVACASLATFLAAPLQAQRTIEHLAPENTVFIAGFDNVQGAINRAKETKLWELWQTQRLQDAVGRHLLEFTNKIKELERELGVEEGSITWPRGSFGIAAFPVMNDDMGMHDPGILVVADYGPEADKVWQLVTALNERGRKEGKVEIDEEEVLGRTVIVVRRLEEEPQEADPDAMEWEDAPDPMEDAFKIAHFVRDGSTFMLCSHMEPLTDALSAIDGEARKGFEERADFRGVISQLGERDGYAVMLTRGLGELMAAGDPMGMMMMVQPMLEKVFGDIRGFGLGVRMDGPVGMVEESIAIYMPNGASGLMGLLDTQSPRGNLPAFVGADAVGYSRINFEFSGVLNFVRDVMGAIPMPQDPQEVAQIEQMIEMFTSPLGQQVHIVNLAERPFRAGGQRMLFAIECRDPQALEQAVAGMAAQFGFESRDFLGQRIFAMRPEMAMPGMEPFALGIGGGHVFIAPVPAVEAALRASGQADGPTLARDEEYQRGVNALPNSDVVGWGYSNTVEALESAVPDLKQSLQQQIDMMRQFDPEQAAKMEEWMTPLVQFMEQLDYANLKRYLGPSVWNMRFTSNGLEMRAYLLPGEQ